MSSLTKPENFSGITQKVKMMRLDDWVITAGIRNIDMIKIDAEGSECMVLEGMKNIFLHSKPVLFIEISAVLLSKFNNTPADIYNILKPFGYSAFDIVKPNNLKRLRANTEGDSIVFIHDSNSFPQMIKVSG
jgi:hypothetical protein